MLYINLEGKPSLRKIDEINTNILFINTSTGKIIHSYQRREKIPMAYILYVLYTSESEGMVRWSSARHYLFSCIYQQLYMPYVIYDRSISFQ